MQDGNLAHTQTGKGPQEKHVERGNPNFLEDLEHCKNCDSVHNWAAQYKVDLRKYSRLAFRQIWKSRQSLEIPLAALGESSLNNTDNLNYLLYQLNRRTLAPYEVELISDWFRKTLFLGQWSETQITSIMEFMSNIGVKDKSEELKCGLAASVFEGLETSAVFSMKEVTSSQLELLLETITQGIFTQMSQELGLRIIKALEPSQSKALVRSISLFLQKGIEIQASVEDASAETLCSMDALPKCFNIIWALPGRTSHAVILHTSEALLHRTACLPESDIPMLKLLDQWWSFIKKSHLLKIVKQNDKNKQQLEDLLTGRPLIIVATYLRHLDDFAVARYILRRESRVCLDLANRNRALAEFERFCQEGIYSSPFVSMLRAAHRFVDVPERTMQRIFRLLQMLQRSQSIKDIIVGLRNVNIRISERVMLKTIRTGLHWDHFEAEKIFHAYRELPLEECPELAERMIKNHTRSPLDAVKFFQSRHTGVTPGARAPPKTIGARRQVLQRMALAYANAVHLPHRMAFRYVYYCYRTHMRERLGRLDQGVILALTQTGLLRPLQSGIGVNNSRIQWILSIIRRHEAWQIADEVDRAVYAWRGKIWEKMREIGLRAGSISDGESNQPMIFQSRNRWTPHGYAERIYEPPKDRMRKYSYKRDHYIEEPANGLSLG